MKQIKLLGVMALALTLGLAACNDSGDNGSAAGSTAQKSSKHSHSWGEYTVTKAATCTEDGTEERVCATCNEKQTKTIKAAHTWGEYAVTKPATCAEEGTEERECSVCHEKDVRTIAKADHTWGEWETIAEPDCVTTGSRKHVCSVCQEEASETVPATGHTWGEWEDIEPATCTEDGSRKHKCSVCQTEESETVKALGHNIQLDDDGSPAPEGKAKVRLYTCANGCGTTYFGFKATEVSENAGRLVFEPETAAEGVEQGARFWGRPIGNKMELGEDGSATARPDDLAAVFDETVQGDLFEYVFDLDANQVAAIGDTCLLYCDAKPADYLNGQDFWACDPSAEEWTPGMYIEGDKKGEPIANYRYILYVDDAPVEFDPTMKAPVAASSSGGQWGMGGSTNLARAEFVMPYKFHLHTGENKISLRMAGGYRSLFYNFTFRAVEEQEDPVTHTHDIVVGDKSATSALRPLSCDCGNLSGYQLDAADLTTGQKAPDSTDKNTRVGKNSLFDDVWNITGITAGKYDVYLNAQNSQGNDNAYWNAATAIANGDQASNNGDTPEKQSDYRYKIKVDAGEYAPIGNNTERFSDFGLSNAAAAWTNKPVAQITVANGAASLTIHNMDNGYSIWIYSVRLVKAA